MIRLSRKKSTHAISMKGVHYSFTCDIMILAYFMGGRGSFLRFIFDSIIFFSVKITYNTNAVQKQIVRILLNKYLSCLLYLLVCQCANEDHASRAHM